MKLECHREKKHHLNRLKKVLGKRQFKASAKVESESEDFLVRFSSQEDMEEVETNESDSVLALVHRSSLLEKILLNKVGDFF